MSYAQSYWRYFVEVGVEACGRAFYARFKEHRETMFDEVEFVDRPRSTPIKRAVAKAQQWLADSAPKYPDDRDILTAIEEVAHPFVGMRFGLVPLSATIVPTSENLGLATFAAGGSDEAQLRTALAGPIATRIARGLEPRWVADSLESGDKHISAPDIKRARELTNKICGTDFRWPENRSSVWRDAEREVIELLQSNWETIRTLAYSLLDKQTLTGEEIARLCGRPDIGNKILKHRIEALQGDHETRLLKARAAELRKKF